MKKWLAAIILFLLILNIPVTTRQGINYQWRTIKLPLYLKLLDFFDRHYHYAQLTKAITAGASTQQERAMQIFQWTYKNLKRVPEGFPIVDDHVWSIIVRGYATNDQFSDVFTTLCNYAGMDSFYSLIYTQDRAKSIPLSFVKIKGSWCVFDPYNGVYFEGQEGAGLTERSLGNASEYDYRDFLNNIGTINEDKLNRANIQSPIRRLLFSLKGLGNRH